MTREADGAMAARRLELVRPGDLRALLAEGTRAQHDDGDLEAGRQCFERAYRLAEQASDTESMALAICTNEVDEIATCAAHTVSLDATSSERAPRPDSEPATRRRTPCIEQLRGARLLGFFSGE